MTEGTVRRTRVEAAALTIARAGGRPEENEDSLRFHAAGGTPDDWADFMAVVADGVGSSREPAAASRATTETWAQFLEIRFGERPEDLASFEEAEFSQLMRECFAQAHRQVQRVAPGGSSTAAGVCIQGPWLLAGSVGDARAYHLSDGSLSQLTDDQVDSNGDPVEVLGGRAVAPNAAGYARRGLSPGDWLVVCSDGLTKTLSPAELAALLRGAADPQDAVRALQELARAKRIPDDVSAVVARIDRVGEPFWDMPGSAVGPGTDSASVASRPPRPAAGRIAGSMPKRASPGDAGARSPRPDRAGLERAGPERAGPERAGPERAARASGNRDGGEPDAKRDRGEPDAGEEVAMNTRTSPDVESAVRELEKRVIRLERNPSSGGLSQQEQARLEREFGRLEQEIQGLDARTSRPSGVPAWAVVAALVIGLAAGYLAHSAIGGKGPKTGGGPAEADSGAARSTVKFTLQPPSDLLIPLEDQPTADAVVLRYRSKDGLRKVAVYRYADAGKPSVIYALPAGIEALRRAARPSHGAPAPP